MLVNFDSLKTFYNALKQKMKNYRGNWNQNDPTADDYIKNRTHWAEISEKSLLSKMVVTINDEEGYVELGTIEPLSAGQTYFVSLNGIEYRCVARDWSDEGAVLIGNGTIYGDGVEGNAEPFACDSYSNGYIYLNAEAGKYTISISTIQEVVHQLDKKFVPIPDDVVSEDDLADVAFSGDYNDLYNTPTIYNDVVRYGTTQSLSEAQKSTARANIGAGTSNFGGSYNDLTDKPCSKELVVGETVFNISGMFTKDSNGIYKATFSRSVSATFDKTYTYELIVNNKTYTCIGPQSSSAGYQFGNTNIFTAPEYAMDETAWVLINQSLPSIDIRIKTTTTISGSVSILFKKADITKYSVLDEKYIPDTIARVSDVPNNVYTKEEADARFFSINSLSSNIFLSEPTMICCGNNLFAMTDGRSVSYSDNGVEWSRSLTTTASLGSLYRICYGNNKFFCTDVFGDLAYTTDVTNPYSWTAVTLPIGKTPYINYCNDKFIAVKNGSSSFCYSQAGKTWQTGTLPSAQAWVATCYGDGKYVAIALEDVAAYSTDGIIWTETTLPKVVNGQVNRLCYGNGTFVAYSSDDYATKIFYSTDGINWNVSSQSAAHSKVCYGNGKFIMSKDNSNLLYSSDGINWEESEFSIPNNDKNCIDICFGNNVFLLVCQNQNNTDGSCFVSYDGIRWTNKVLINSNNIATKELANIIIDAVDIPEASSAPMIGATSTTDGTTGTVPAPTSTDSTKFLRGDGTWADVSSSCPIESGVTDILPDKYYTFGTVDSLTINLVDTGDDSKLCEYCFEFIPSENFTGLTITPEPKWAHTIRFIPGMTCQVSILRGIGVMLCA